MKILLIGLLTFSIWSIVATNIYVCQILGLCDNTETTQNLEPIQNLSTTVDTMKVTVVERPALAPEDLTTYFDFDKSEFYSNIETEKYIEELKFYLTQNTQVKLSITGYTDAIGTKKYNQALGYRRTQSMQRYFQSKGVHTDRIVLESYGEKDPADDNSTIEGRANNRRTVITINN